ncbi:MAG: carboxymuconolactone decarboxylase family protein [Xanthomonadales bacterium]|nr:carboxymuconolactone decarboxylase family protein [Xanthomonadales bacterium]
MIKFAGVRSSRSSTTKPGGIPVMTKFEVHTHETAPENSKGMLQAAEKAFGFVPNISAVLAESPATLKAYLTLSKIFDDSSFSATERQVVILTINEYNNCHYCVAAHSAIAAMQGVPGDVVSAIREGRKIDDARIEALRSFTRQIVDQRGWVDEAAVQAFLDAGFQHQQVMEVILGVAMKTISNYTNHIAQTPLDEAFEPHAWQPGAPADTAGQQPA